MAAEVGLAAFSGIVSEGAKSLFEPIIRQIAYVFKYQSYIDELKYQVKQLGFKREMVQQPVNLARRQDHGIYEGVTDWLHNVDEFISKAKSIIDDENGAKKSCFKGLCPNLLSRYKLSEQAAKAAKDAADLVGKGNFSTVSYPLSPKSTEYMQVKDLKAFDSRMKVFQDVMEALRDDNLNIIGVYGMGGVGKTTLVNQVAKQVMEDKLFDKVVMAEVTQTPDHHKIQDKLAFDLRMEFDLNKNEFQRAYELCQRLKKEKRLLIILDNIWTKLEFDKVGIPYGDVDEKDREDDRSRRTIILTSRRRDLLCKDMNCEKKFSIEVLSKEEALQLFGKMVCNSAKASAFQPLADEIVEKCGGLPVALITLAKALKNEKLDTWKDVLNQLKNSNAKEIDGMEIDVYIPIKLSYDLLGSKEAKSLFLLCGLFSEGHAIPVSSLLIYCMGMGYFKKVYTLEKARCRVHTLIGKLKSSCLLLDGDAEDEVKMHDVIRVVAVSIAEEELMFNIPNDADLKKKMEETIQKDPIAISLPYGGDQVLPQGMRCPRLGLCLLHTNDRFCSIQASDQIFEGMEGLKVLKCTGIHFPSLPSSLDCLINLQTLCLDGCRLKDIAKVGQLEKLEVLSFRDSNIEQLPLEIGQLTGLRLLDLTNCWGLQVIAPNVISKLTGLEELYMGNSFERWEKVEGGSNASLVELSGLKKLTTLEIDVRDAEILPQDLVSVELQSYRIRIGNEWWGRWSVKSETSRLMKLHGLEKFGILLRNPGMRMLLQRTEDLWLETLEDVQSGVHELDGGEGFPRLKHLHVESCSEILHIVGPGRQVLHVESCSEILHIVGPGRQVRCEVFPLLESLTLYKLINLEAICYSQLREDQSFSNLRIIKVRSCPKLKHLFSFSMAKKLLRLQKVEVEYCDDLEMIIGLDTEKPTTTQGSTEIIAEDDQVSLELKLGDLISIEKLWPDQFQGMYCCQNLTKLTVWRCGRLKYLFSYSMVNSLGQLQHLEIRDCWSIEGVVNTTGGLGGRDELKVFPKLHCLSLHRLRKLSSFASPVIHPEMQPQPLFDEKVQLPSLEVLDIYSIDKLRKIWHHQLASKSFSKLKKLGISRCHNLVNIFPPLEEGELRRWEGNLNSTIQKCYKEMIGFRDIEYLQFSHFPRLKEIWHDQALPVGFFNNLAELVVDDCENMSSAIPANLLRWLNNLKLLEVRNCDSIEEVLHLEELNADREQIGPLFRAPFELRLIDLPKLKRFCNFTGNIIEMPELWGLIIENCPDMETFISNSMETFISNSVVHVTTNNKEPQKLTSEENFLLARQIQPLFNEKVAFPQLIWLELSGLHKVQHLWKENAESNKAFANLVSIEVSECSKLQKLVPPSWHLENLRELEVSKCHGLINVLTLSTSESLVNLERMKVTDCKMMKEIIQSQVREEAEDCIVFRKFKYLVLDCLPSLTSFCLGNHALEFPSLEHVVVRMCPTMNIFSRGVVDAPKLNKVKPIEAEDGDEVDDDDEEGCWEGNLNDTIKKLFNEMNSKEQIEPTLQVQ